MKPNRKSHAKEAVRLATGRDPEALLRELYLDRRHSQSEIAAALGINRMTVAAWLAEYGIAREDRREIAL